METTLTTVCRHLRNFFKSTKESGEFSLAGGKITLKGKYLAGQYVLLSGKILADGIYKITAADNGVYTLDGAAIDEEWTGDVYGLRMPTEFLELVEQINTAVAKEKKNAGNGNVRSENWVNYSYTLASGDGGKPITWKEAFASRLTPWRKMYEGDL